MHMFACDDGVGGRRVLRLADRAGVFELGLLSGEAVFDVGVIAVLDVLVLDAGHLVGVLFWKDLAVLDGLDGGVVVVLMDFAVDGRGGLLMARGSYMLLLNSRVNCLVGVRLN
jgi:hypothetical protein